MVLPMKRGRSSSSGSELAETEQKVLAFIKSKENNGIARNQIKYGTQLADSVITKSINSLKVKNLIKEVINVKNKRIKHYMGVEFQPTDELSGGQWYVDGELDVGFIEDLRKVCKTLIEKRVGSVEQVSDSINKLGVVPGGIGKDKIEQILKMMVLDGEIEQVISNGKAEFSSFPIREVCYRVSVPKLSKLNPFSSIPCGVCPQISHCSVDGIISPTTCVYYKKWLDF